MSNTVPSGWSVHELGDLAHKIEGGGTPSRTEASFWNGNIPWATVKDLRAVSLRSTEEHITELGLKNSSSKLIPANTIIIATRMAVGKAVFFDRDVAINQDLKAFHPKNGINWRFLLQWYLAKSEKIESLATGSTVKGIRLDELKLLPIDLPPLPEQQKIAAILSSVDDVIEKTRAQIDKLKDLKTGMMQELLTKGIGSDGAPHTEFKDSTVGRIPANWKVIPLEELCTKVSVGIASSTTHAYASGGVPLLRNQNILPNAIRYTDVLHISREFSEENASKKIREGDVLTVRTGYPGISAVVPKAFDGCHSFTTLISRPKQSLLNPHYLSLLINSDYGKHFVVGGQAGGAQQNLNATTLKTFPVLLPPLSEQVAIYDAANSVSAKIALVEKRYRLLIDSKKALMQDLLTGKVRVKVDQKESAVA